jgi:dTDP-4-dehydrorhamnose reductase
MKVLIIGKNGQLGKSIQKIVKIHNNNYKFKSNDVFFVGREQLDLSKNNSINNYFNSNNIFDIIVNCAAYTSVDKAEDEKELAIQINHLAVKKIAQIAKKQQAKLIHISTDYVFDGESDIPYIETDETNPINVYGQTKLDGEQLLREIMPTGAIIIRTSWVYSEYGSNFVKTMLKLGKERDEISVISDQIGSPTYASDLASAILEIIEKNTLLKEVELETQVYHYSNDGAISWYDFAKEIFKLANLDCKVNPIKSEQYTSIAKRPRNSVMSKTKIKNSGITLCKYKSSIKNCLTMLSINN